MKLGISDKIYYGNNEKFNDIIYKMISKTYNDKKQIKVSSFLEDIRNEIIINFYNYLHAKNIYSVNLTGIENDNDLFLMWNENDKYKFIFNCDFIVDYQYINISNKEENLRLKLDFGFTDDDFDFYMVGGNYKRSAGSSPIIVESHIDCEGYGYSSGYGDNCQILYSSINHSFNDIISSINDDHQYSLFSRNENNARQITGNIERMINDSLRCLIHRMRIFGYVNPEQLKTKEISTVIDNKIIKQVDSLDLVRFVFPLDNSKFYKNLNEKIKTFIDIYFDNISFDTILNKNFITIENREELEQYLSQIKFEWQLDDNYFYDENHNKSKEKKSDEDTILSIKRMLKLI